MDVAKGEPTGVDAEGKGGETTTQKEKASELSRRDFVKAAALGAGLLTGAGALAGCGTSAPPMVPGIPDHWDEEADVVIVGAAANGGGGLHRPVLSREWNCCQRDGVLRPYLWRQRRR
jgi:hypothetical protein